MPMPPNDQPPAWFMAQWLNPENWEWDAERSRYVIVLRNHMVQIVTRKGIDWTWRVKRLRGFGFTVWHIGGFGFQSARDARRDALAVFWSDLWTCRPDHEKQRHFNTSKPTKLRKALVSQRAQWAAEIETNRMEA
jgi:hypothetical protein